MTSPTSPPVALITGGTTGIGLATARVLHAQGFAVLITGRNPDTLAAARRTLPDDVVVFRADARSPADAEQVGAELQRRFGKVDVAFLNAGIGRFTPLDSADENLYDELFDINVKGQFFTLQKILHLLGEGSSVIFNSSVFATKGAPNWSVYSATKGALVSLARSLAIELAPRKIRVNSISPGPIETPALSKAGLPADQMDQVKEGFAGMVPMQRFGSDDEVARAVAFLASSAASYITGSNLVVDGGFGAG
ncbi:MAG: SDR family oxidoreductase [Actinobacteria bacterium]|nr:SDR family oxidoreductase [Actinomycetota bacterium]MBI3685921.1 SDR family oxidoreductase [Actinomycetota bacterium]